jgi:putative beta-lysine N-acetyltransferase
MANDRIESLGGSIVQHGPNSDRIYLMKLADGDAEQLADRLDALAARHGYSKILAKVPARAKQAFFDREYSIEARVPRFFDGREECLFLGKYLTQWRNEDPEAGLVQQVLRVAAEKAPLSVKQEPDLQVRVLEESQAEQMTELYARVFDSYPFPINEPGYIIETMRSHVRYFGVFQGDTLLALASAEMDRDARNVEMTDFATLPEARGKGLAGVLLSKMETNMQEERIATSYTIARARSFGMNVVFARAGYTFGGTLVNNTDIAGGLESMNVWYKPLLHPENG